MNLDEKLGYAMKTERLVNRKTLQQVADKMGMAKNTISNYENGKISISVVKLKDYCEAIGTDFYTFLNKVKEI